MWPSWARRLLWKQEKPGAAPGFPTSAWLGCGTGPPAHNMALWLRWMSVRLKPGPRLVRYQRVSQRAVRYRCPRLLRSRSTIRDIVCVILLRRLSAEQNFWQWCERLKALPAWIVEEVFTFLLWILIT